MSSNKKKPHKGENESGLSPPIRFCPIETVDDSDDDSDTREEEISLKIDKGKKGTADNQVKFKFPYIRTLDRTGSEFVELRRRMDDEIFQPF